MLENCTDSGVSHSAAPGARCEWLRARLYLTRLRRARGRASCRRSLLSTSYSRPLPADRASTKWSRGHDRAAAAAICGTTACVAKRWWRRLTARFASQYSGVTSSSWWRSSRAALLIRMRIGPKGVARGGDRARSDIAHVAMPVAHEGTELGGECLRRRVGDIDEGDPATLRRETADESGAYAGRRPTRRADPPRDIGGTRAIFTGPLRRSKSASSHIDHLYHTDDLALSTRRQNPRRSTARRPAFSHRRNHDLPVNHFKPGDHRQAAWLSSGSPAAAEARPRLRLSRRRHRAHAGRRAADDRYRAPSPTPAQAIVRPPWNDMVMLKRVLDAGGQSLLLPFVQNEEEAKRAVAFTRYPPAGVRGAAGTHRAARTHSSQLHENRGERASCVIVQMTSSTRAPRGDRSRRGRRLDLRRSQRSCGVDGPCGRHGPRGGAGEGRVRRQGVQAARQTLRDHRRHAAKSSPPISSTVIHGSRSTPHGDDGGPRAGLSRQGAGEGR